MPRAPKLRASSIVRADGSVKERPDGKGRCAAPAHIQLSKIDGVAVTQAAEAGGAARKYPQRAKRVRGGARSKEAAPEAELGSPPGGLPPRMYLEPVDLWMEGAHSRRAWYHNVKISPVEAVSAGMNLTCLGFGFSPIRVILAHLRTRKREQQLPRASPAGRTA